MNRNLHQLLRMIQDPEEVIYTIRLVDRVDRQAVDVTKIEMDAFHALHTAVINFSRYCIADFTHGGKIPLDLDKPAQQMGIDTTAEGPTLPDPDHVCTEETMMFRGQYAAPGIGNAYICSCGKGWAKIGDTFYEEEIGAHIGDIEDFR